MKVKSFRGRLLRLFDNHQQLVASIRDKWDRNSKDVMMQPVKKC